MAPPCDDSGSANSTAPIPTTNPASRSSKQPASLVSLPTEVKLEIYLNGGLDYLSIEALARSCKDFYAVYVTNTSKIRNAERKAWKVDKLIMKIELSMVVFRRDVWDLGTGIRALADVDPVRAQRYRAELKRSWD